MKLGILAVVQPVIRSVFALKVSKYLKTQILPDKRAQVRRRTGQRRSSQSFILCFKAFPNNQFNDRPAIVKLMIQVLIQVLLQRPLDKPKGRQGSKEGGSRRGGISVRPRQNLCGI